MSCRQPYNYPAYAAPNPDLPPYSPTPGIKQPRPQTIYKQLRCDSPRSKEEYELCQPWRQAEAAHDAACTARWQFYGGAFGLVLILATFLANAVSGWGAKRAADVAAQSLTELERAFVVFKTMRCGEAYRLADIPGVDVRERQFVPVTVSLENSGATPTRSLRMQVNFSCFTKPGMPGSFEFLDADLDGKDPVSIVIGPRQTRELVDFGISFRALEEIQDGNFVGYMWGWAEYDDIFESTPRRRTEFCFWIAKVTPPISKPVIEWHAHTQHNGMDKDCPAERWQTLKGGAFKEPRRPKLPPAYKLQPTE